MNKLNSTHSRLIVSECLLLLKEHGLGHVSVSGSSYLGDIFERHFLEWLGPIEPVFGPDALGLPEQPSREKIDLITLEWANRFTKHGVRNASEAPELFRIRKILTSVLNALGHLDVQHALAHNSVRTIWPCYKAWEDVARQSGVPKHDIDAARAKAKAEHPEGYQE